MTEFATSTPDPFILKDTVNPQFIQRATDGLTPRSQVINPAQKTLVLIVAGQSNWTNVTPTLSIPLNSTAIDNFNIFDGASYPISGPLLGCTTNPSPNGPGNIAPRLADILINNGIFNRVVIVPITVSGVSVTHYAAGGALDDRMGVAMLRLASRGITPATTGATFAWLWGQGETDALNGMSQATYTANLNSVLAGVTASGFVGRRFIPIETRQAGTNSAAVAAAQSAAVDNVTVFSGGNLDVITNRQADGTHFDDTGAGSAALAVYNSMHASGAPY